MIPPKEIPSEYLSAFTLQGRIPVESWYINSNKNKGPLVYEKDQVDKFMHRAKNRQVKYYGDTDLYLYEALEKYPINKKTVGIIGSQIPWYESICLFYKGKPITVEYQKITSQDRRLTLKTVEEYQKNPVTFDCAFSISSFEHDGLGRYGDPINPDGDLEAMKRMKDMIAPGGLLYLAVPVGKDVIVWNAHRVYGRTRLPMLLEGWKVIDSFGFDEQLYDQETDQGRHSTQPIFVLQN